MHFFFHLFQLNILLSYILDSKQISQQMRKILQHNLTFNGSFKNLEAVTQIINSTPNASHQVPTTNYKIKKFVDPLFDSEFHLKCPQCKKFSKTTSNEIECSFCFVKLRTSQTEYFAYIPVGQQMRMSIEKKFDDIISYYSYLKSQGDILSDIHSGERFKRAESKYPKMIILPLVANTDGANIYKSSSKSIWLIQCYQSFLPPSYRFVPENIIIAAAHFGPKKPCMKSFFYPFLNELQQITNTGGIVIERGGKVYRFMPLLLNCCSDLPAKAEVQCLISFSGRFVCGYCLHSGISVKPQNNGKAVIRYVKRNKSYQLRTHGDFIETYRRLKGQPINGIKGISCMIAADQFDLVNGFGLDYMHCTLLGVVKKMLSLWLDSVHHSKQFHLNMKQQTTLNDRLLSIKPISDVTRRPRSIFNRADFKANEFRSLLLFYLPLTLPDLLPSKYVKHFQLLSSSIYIYLKKNISIDDFILAASNLNQFVDDYERLYGEENVTMNVHLTTHLSMAVKNLGPLWCQSLFGFESNNGVVVKSNTCSNDNVLHQLQWKYVLRNTIDSTIYEKKILLKFWVKRK